MSYTDPFNGHKIIDDQHRYKEHIQPVPPVPPVGSRYIVVTKPLTGDEWKTQLLAGHLNLQSLAVRPDLFIGLFRNSLKLKIDNEYMDVSYSSSSGEIEIGADGYISGITLNETPIEPYEAEAEEWELVYIQMQVIYS